MKAPTAGVESVKSVESAMRLSEINATPYSVKPNLGEKQSKLVMRRWRKYLDLDCLSISQCNCRLNLAVEDWPEWVMTSPRSSSTRWSLTSNSPQPGWGAAGGRSSRGSPGTSTGTTTPTTWTADSTWGDLHTQTHDTRLCVQRKPPLSLYQLEK